MVQTYTVSYRYTLYYVYIAALAAQNYLEVKAFKYSKDLGDDLAKNFHTDLLLLKIIKLELFLWVKENKNIKVYGKLDKLDKTRTLTPLSEPPAFTQEAGRVQTL